MSDLTTEPVQSGKITLGGNSDRSRTAIIVLGMHRSGTSAYTRLLSLLGATLPRNLLPPSPDNNVKGFWEADKLVRLHDRYLARIGSSWSDVLSPFNPLKGLPEAGSLSDAIAETLRDEFGELDCIVIKDPRICRLLPIWEAALDAIDASPKFVIPVRNVLEVGASLHRRDNIDLHHASVLWLSHVLASEQYTRKLPRVFVDFNLLFADWREAAIKISRALRISWKKGYDAVREDVESFLSPDLRHHKFSSADVLNHPDVPALAKEVQRVADRVLTTDEIDPAEWDALSAKLSFGEDTFGPLLRSAQGTVKELGIKAAEHRQALQEARDELLQVRRDLDERSREVAQLRHALEVREARSEEEIASLKLALRTRSQKVSALLEECRNRGALAAELIESWQRKAARSARPSSLSRLALRAGGIADVVTSYTCWILARIGLLKGPNPIIKFDQACRLRRYRKSGLFDEDYYLRLYPDVAQAGHDAAWHYDVFGAREGRKPHPAFDTRFYLSAHPDVARAGFNPLHHFLVHGCREGRRIHPST